MSAVELSALFLAGAPIPADVPPAPVPAVLQFQEIQIPEFLAGGDAVAPPAPPSEPTAQPAPADPAAEPVPAESGPPATVGADIVVMSDPPAPPGDPLVEINQQSFEATQAVDQAVVEPIAKTYEEVPKPVRSGLRNFFRNLASPVIFLNFMLQLKPGKAMETLGRFAINSTIGLAGFIDVAKKDPFNLPHRANGFANTLGYYGVGPGPYFYLPLIGSTTLRDAFGGAIDGLVLPLTVGAPFNDPKFTVPRGAIRSLDYRVEYDEQIEELLKDDDPYTTLRERYLAARQAEIDALRGIKHDSAAFPLIPLPEAAAPAPSPVEAGPVSQPASAPPVTEPTQSAPPVEQTPVPVQAPEFAPAP